MTKTPAQRHRRERVQTSSRHWALTADEYVSVLRSRWLVLLIAMVMGVTGGLVANQLIPKTYSAEGEMLLVLEPAGATPTATDLEITLRTARQLAVTYGRLGASGLVSDSVSHAMEMPVEEVSGRIRSYSVQGTSIIHVVATGRTGTEAEELATAGLDAIRTQYLEGSDALGLTKDTAVTSPPTGSARLATPTLAILLTIGGLFGLGGGLFIAFLVGPGRPSSHSPRH